MKLTKAKLKQIIKEELGAMFPRAGAGPPQFKPHVVSSRGFSRGPVEHDGYVVDDNDGKGWPTKQDALNALTDSGEWKQLQQKHKDGILYPEVNEEGKAVIYFLPS